ncbi:MAG: tetratricopeptide repeat protein [Polyangiales bacterium]
MTSSAPAPVPPSVHVHVGPTRAQRWFWPLLFVIVSAGLGRAFWATRLDGVNIDEAWHVVAGVSYVRTGDFRLNPEHPPLIKLWIGAWLPERVFKLPPFRPMLDKEGEREFTDDTFYIQNDMDRTQARFRIAMLALHGLMLVWLATTLRRRFDATVALAAIGVFLLDPTIAAHLPLAMTDLSVTLLGAIAMLLTLEVWERPQLRSVSAAALALGGTLAAKHSGLVAVLAVGASGALGLGYAAFRSQPRPSRDQLQRRAAGIFGVLLGAYLVLWGSYGFRFQEGHTSQPTAAEQTPPLLFNRALEDKIADLQSPSTRALLQLAVDLHLLPRAYLWGLADIMRVGVEGRYEELYLFGKRLEGDTPWYFFPALLTVKLPLGLGVLAVGGLLMLLWRRVPREWLPPVLALFAWCGLFLLFLMRGNSGYAGVRHELPVYPAIALLAALPLAAALQPWGRALRGVTALALIGLLASALPVVRPWEYYNELVGSADAWRYFSDDGVDIRQRGPEIAAYYAAHVAGSGEPAYDFYGLPADEKKARGLQLRALEQDPVDSDTLQGTLFVNARWLTPRPTYDFGLFREAQPVARYGNLVVLRGTFHARWLRAAKRRELVGQALTTDRARAEKLLEEVVAIYPEDYRSSFELGNMLLERGATDAARRAYQLSHDHAPPADLIVGALAAQIALLSRSDVASASLRPIRNPWLE